MNSDDEFAISGPKHMMVEISTGSSPTKMIGIDWDNREHRRCITACLTKGIYVMENDRSRKRDQELAPAWWESFHFRLCREFECECKCPCCNIRRHISGDCTRFTYGAVFEYLPPNGAPCHPSAPNYIVAFRGTMPRDPTFFRDLGNNLKIMVNKQHFCSRFSNARKMVEQLLNYSKPNDGSCVVWLAGHSLGASIALDVGRDMMVARERNLPTFLFNPPQVSLAPALSGMDDKAKRDLYFFSYSMKHALGKTILRPLMKHMEELFEKLTPWVPELYVHDRDLICKGFIEYFMMREKVRQLSPEIAKSGTMLSYRDGLIFSAVVGFGKKNRERPHLLPSARLWQNSTSKCNAHELRQWWQPELMLSFKKYSWD
ncbi:unnamed protein product [Urochloa humidicola]